MRVFCLLWIFIQTSGIIGNHPCPQQCSCKRIGAQAEWLKVKCEDHIQEIREFDFNDISVALIQLDLSKNDIYAIESDVLQNLTNLRRLDLSSNKITTLDEGSFRGLESLERLDLSDNQISTIDTHTFKKLQNLKRLKLNGNSLKTLKEGTFHGVKSLKQLDLSNNPWECNCNLYWFSNWIHNTSIKLNPPPKCASPPSLRNQPMKKLRLSEELQCQLSSPAIEIRPGHNQVVFAGDSITLKCRAPSITEDKNARLSWLWNPNITNEVLEQDAYTDPRNTLSNIKVENRHLADSGIVDSSLSIVPLTEEHNGQWNCQLVSVYGNKSKAISVIVISDETRYCPLAVTRNNKGMYAWPRTVVGWKVELPCEGSRLSGLMQFPLRASYRCNATGNWEDLNTEPCPYISHTTKVLEQFSKVNLSLTKGNLLETAKRFKNYTGDGAKLTDPIEINFIIQTVENYLHFLIEEKELGIMLIDIVSAIMNLPKDMLKLAENYYKSCTRLIKAVETITEFTPSIQIHKNNMALEEFRVKRENFMGLTCTWYSNAAAAGNAADTKLLHCATSNKTALINTKDKVIEASIQLPASLLKQLDGVMVAHQLMISMYSDNRLFPKILSDDKMDIASCVIGSKLIGVDVENLSEPVYVMLKAPLYHYAGSKLKPVVWDTKFNESGGWTSDGCQLSNLVNNLIVFHCNRLGYYGLLQDTSYLNEEGGSLTGATFKYSHPAVYVGSFVAIVCLTFTSVTYMICYASIIMPKKVKHCIVNTWIAIALLCFLYTAGIHQTENVQICQGVGLVLHYLSLCCLLWMAMSASNMYKRLSKSDADVVPDDELPDQPIQKPLLGLYMVGWGIALIICGISGAINLREYASYSHCFLTSGPALAALFIPGAILIVYLTIFHLLIRCAIRNVDLNAQLSEGTQATENMDLELLEPNANPNMDRNSVHSAQTVSSEVEDLEHSQIAQLKGQIIILILYLMTWTSGASATAKPLSPYVPYEESVFAILYAISASSLGMFVLLFYGMARKDVGSQWLRMRCWFKKKKNRCCRTRSVSDTSPAIPAQPLVQNLAPLSNSQATQVISDTNSIGSSARTSKSQNCNSLKGADLNSSEGPPGAKIANVNLVVLHRQQYRSNNSVTTYTEPTPACVEMFYNPHQSGVARKFFKKQRRHTKNNTLGPRKQGDGGATSDGGSCISIPRPNKTETDIERSIFSSSAKVNNTNIHVEVNLVNDSKNVNILSDSGGSVSEERNVAKRFVIGQENITRSTKKVNNDRLLTQESEEHLATFPRDMARRKLYHRHHLQYKHDNNTLNESDAEAELVVDPDLNADPGTKAEEEKHLRNVSQQCSLEYSSEMESTQMTSERSDHNLPEIGETPERTEENDRCSSANEMSDLDEQKSKRSFERLNHSNSLYCLPIDHLIPVRNYRRSLNDVSSLTSSKNCEYSRPSLTDLQSVASSNIYDRVRGSRKTIDRSQQSLIDINSLTSDNTYAMLQERPNYSNSLLDVDSASGSCANEQVEFQPVLNNDLKINDVEERPDASSANGLSSLNFLDKDFDSLTDLATVEDSLNIVRQHLDINGDMGMEFEEKRFTRKQMSCADENVEVLKHEDEYQNDNSVPKNVKKETSV
ncbi:adhesion G protein-coupled receptor A3 isoform X2 [Cephus cinctus]|uniref:Adhesion G protein-coupled receptor A3 isoform X2 n=1 Tax=Cephus cinctus TaxID=211228 RepID=A0AAJ7W4E8_CEPCN|nr:adhesion G protein-coupled receptor A3 isoform X2 [Cephus cinctus]